MKNKRLKWIVIAFCSVLVSVSLSAQETDEILRKKIEAANEIIDKAALEHDYETIAAYYTDDVIILPNSEPLIQGKKAFIKNEREAEKAGFKVLSIKDSIIVLFSSGDLIHQVGEYEISLQVPGVPYPITDKGKYLVIWQKQTDDSLKIKLEMWNNDERSH